MYQIRVISHQRSERQAEHLLSATQSGTQCSDGIDNDGDGLTDLDDPGCSNAQDDDETAIYLGDLKIQRIQDSQTFTCVLDSSGNCHYPQAHSIQCPSGYKAISGSCTIGGWHTTKTWDRPDGNGWICKYAEYGHPAYAGQTWPVVSTVSVTCIEDDPALVAVEIVSDTKNISSTLDSSGNTHYPLAHRVECPSGTKLTGGSCTIGGWHTTKTWDRPDGNGWICKYAESGNPAYAGQTWTVSSTATALCLTDVQDILSFTVASETKTLWTQLDGNGNYHSQSHTVSCPTDYMLIGGSCTIGGWHTTVTWDKPEGEGWTCKYAEYGNTSYAGQTWQVISIPSAICAKGESACNDGIDNEGDGLTDLDDPGCSDAQDDDESDGTSHCQDGIDNDGDGAVDYPDDFSCSSAQDDDEAGPQSQCQDGADNDGDGLTDLDDPGCSDAQDNDESGEITSDCGNGIREADEDCDDSNTIEDDGCSSSCQKERGFDCQGEPSVCETVCGDGIIVGEEACDDSNQTSGDGCTDECKLQPGFSCLGEPSTCLPICGDGLIFGDEECDDGNKTFRDGCSSVCEAEEGFRCTGEPSNCTAVEVAVVPTVVEAPLTPPPPPPEEEAATPPTSEIAEAPPPSPPEDEAAAPGAPPPPTEETPTPVEEAAVPAPGVPTAPPVEEAAAPPAEEAPPAEAEVEAVCGNGEVEGDEECDDGNSVDTDGCTNACRTPFCGDGIVSFTEECDEGESNSDTVANACRSNCTRARCGDRVVDTGEQCDDGNRLSGDGCSSVCKREICGDGVTQAGLGEECDDGNRISGDGCSSECKREIVLAVAAVCGDGRIETEEQCDDGNRMNGDGCSRNCESERGYVCSREPSVCKTRCGDGMRVGEEKCDDGNIVGNDGCSSGCREESGYVCSGEPSVCKTMCGDGIRSGVEECDDGNLIAGDGCSPACQREVVTATAPPPSPTPTPTPQVGPARLGPGEGLPAAPSVQPLQPGFPLGMATPLTAYRAPVYPTVPIAVRRAPMGETGPATAAMMAAGAAAGFGWMRRKRSK